MFGKSLINRANEAQERAEKVANPLFGTMEELESSNKELSFIVGDINQNISILEAAKTDVLNTIDSNSSLLKGLRSLFSSKK